MNATRADYHLRIGTGIKIYDKSHIFVMFCLWIKRRLVARFNMPLIRWLIEPTKRIRHFARAYTTRDAALHASPKKTLLVGTEEQLDHFIDLLQKSCPVEYSVIGLIITQSFPGQRKAIRGLPILGKMAAISAIMMCLGQQKSVPTDIILISAELRGAELMGFLSAIDDKIRVSRILESKANSSIEVYPISIDDVLDRFPRQVSLQDNINIRYFIAGRRILITGAGGSIGRELVRQISFFDPASIILLEQNEYALWKVGLELAEHFPHVQQHQVLADIQKRDILKCIFTRFRPQLVFHAAALKHVPFVEKNPCEGVLTNVIGTRNVADCARDYGADVLVFISTDKAVYPSNIMGASKRCAEMYIQALDQQARASKKGMWCVNVRFGNVLGSTGSVVPLFRRQLAHGGPLTVTHPDMTRYFMTIPEAVGLVLQAAQYGAPSSLKGDNVKQDHSVNQLKSGSVFVLDMGEPIRVMDVARYMIRLSGLQPDRDVAIHIMGRREGEKLAETLFYEDEALLRTDHDGLWIATSNVIAYERMNEHLNQLERLCYLGQEAKLRILLQQLIPEFLSQNVQV